MTFCDFMHAALYDRELGYYNSAQLEIGPKGDYYTSSNVHPAFGVMLAKMFAGFASGRFEHWTLVEMGPGTGQLACDVLSSLRDNHPSVFEHLTYILVETSPALQARQQNKLVDFVKHVRWCELADLDPSSITGIVFSNEFIDALPVHRVRYFSGNLEEQYVAASGTGEGPLLSLVWGEPSTGRLNEELERMGVRLREGQVVEIQLAAIDWLARAADALNEGLIITIDYGDISQLLYAPDRHRGTLRSFFRHRLVDSPLERPGKQDITASVNFSSLIDYGRGLGLEMVSYERQSAFLIRMGLIELIADEQTPVPTQVDINSRLALKNLFVPGGVSDNFRVLIQRKVSGKS